MEPQPHCADHAVFHPECVTCQRALANTQPYPVRTSKPEPPRAYGYTDNITEDTFKESRHRSPFVVDANTSLSRSALRLILKLIWPFSKWDI